MNIADFAREQGIEVHEYVVPELPVRTTYEFLWQYRDLAEAIVKRLTKRAKRLGVEFSATISPEFTRRHETTPDAVGNTVVYLYGEVTFDVARLKLPGWKLLGVITPMPTEDGGVVLYPTAVPGETLPADVREWTMKCDKCGTSRRRTETFIVQSDAGEVKQVGRNCIADFLGVDPSSYLTNFDFQRDIGSIGDEFGSFSGRRDFDTLDSVLAHTAAVVRVKGWMSKGRAFETNATPTSGWVQLLIAGPDRYSSDEERAFCRDTKVTDADRDAAADAREWWMQNTETSDYAQNGALLARAGVVIPKAYGLAVSLLPVWQKRIADDAAKAELNKGTVNEYVGVIGKRQEFEVVILTVKDFDSDWGMKSLVTMKATTGHVLKWWAAGGAPEEVRNTQGGEVIKIKGTPKQHSEYNGRRETTLSRVAVVTPKGAK